VLTLIVEHNPGSKLKTAVTTKPSKLKKGSKSANRRKSFCARMSGMKKKLTSAKTANDPDSRINKSLRKWNCSYEPDGTPIMEEG
jgi:predicted RNase H-like nuclease